jgi:hypothetical protein
MRFSKSILAAFVLCATLAPTSALIVAAAKKDDDDKVDRFGQVKIKPVAAYVASAAIVSGATAVQVMTPGWLKGCLGAACESGVGKMCLDCITALDDMKRTNPLG